MHHSYKKVLIAICLFLLQKSDAQYIDLVVLDKATQKPIPYYSVSNLKRTINGVGSEDGKVQLNIEHSENDDTLLISSLGYLEAKVSLSALKRQSIKIELEPNYTKLSDIAIFSTRLNWQDIVLRAVNTIALQSQGPFESIIYRNTSIENSNQLALQFSVRGKMHDEGLDINQMIQNRKDYSWTIYDSLKSFFINKNEIISDYNGRGIIYSDTYFEKRAIKFIFPISLTHYDYELKGIQMLNKDTVFAIAAKVNNKKRGQLNLIDRKMFSTLYSFVPASRTYYINFRTFEFVKIEFEYELTKRKINNFDVHLKKIEGFVYFSNFNRTPHPTFLELQHHYKEKDTNYVRKDIVQFTNIKRKPITNEEMKQKYHLRAVRGEFPGRTVDEDDEIFINRDLNINIRGINKLAYYKKVPMK
jgi:hypothetical protein